MDAAVTGEVVEKGSDGTVQTSLRPLYFFVLLPSATSQPSGAVVNGGEAGCRRRQRRRCWARLRCKGEPGAAGDGAAEARERMTGLLGW